MNKTFFQDLESKPDHEVALLVPKDKEVFAVLIRRYEGALIRYVARLGILNPEDKVDVVQNTFIKAYKNIHSFDAKFPFSSWIYRIAHNEAISFFRAKKARPEGHTIENAEEFIDRIYDDNSSSDIAEEINNKINAEHINKALNNLEDKYKNILILRYFEDKDYSEISDILEIPSGSVATLIHRAKKQLANNLSYIDEVNLDYDAGGTKVEETIKSRDKKSGFKFDVKNITKIQIIPDLSKIPILDKISKISDMPFIKKENKNQQKKEIETEAKTEECLNSKDKDKGKTIKVEEKITIESK